MPQEATALPLRQRATGYEPYRPSALNRIIVGTVLALGLYLALRKLATGWLLANTLEPDAWWLTAEGLRVVFGVQAIAAIVGAMLAGAGRPLGFFVGATVGVCCGGLFLAAEVYTTQAAAFDLVLLIQPGILLGVGAVAGAVGSRIWPTPPDVEKPLPAAPDKLSSIQMGMAEVIEPGRPTAWLRILAGALVMLAAVAFAERFRFTMQKYTEGGLKVESRAQGRFMSWQLASMAALIGAAFAGAGTGAGLRHGIFAGVLAGAGVVGLGIANGKVEPAIEFWLDRLQLSNLGVNDPSVMIVVAGGIALAGAAGGWLGGTLFQPLAPAHMRKKKLNLDRN